MEGFLFIIFIIVICIAGFAWEESEKSAAIAKIEKYIHHHGGTRIVIHDHTNTKYQGRTFKLSYTDPYGTKRYTHCKASQQLYWTKDPAVYALPAASSKLQIIDSLTTENQSLRARLSDKSSSNLQVVSSKEQIITDLTNQNQQLQAQLAALQQQIDETENKQDQEIYQP